MSQKRKEKVEKEEERKKERKEEVEKGRLMWWRIKGGKEGKEGVTG